MGMFDFVKDVGAMLGIGDGDKADADAIKESIADLGLEADGLDIRVEGDVVKISGKSESQEIKEKLFSRRAM